MKIRKTSAAILLAAVFLFILGCSDSEVRASAKAAAGVAHGLSLVESQIELWHDAGKLSDDEARAGVNAVKDATVANDAFVGCVRAAKDKGTGVACYQALETSLQGDAAVVLHIKNPDAQASLRLAFQSVDTAIAIIQSFLNLSPKSVIN